MPLMQRWGAAITAALTPLLLPAVALGDDPTAYRGTDLFGNVAGDQAQGGLANQYPLANYGFDTHIAGPSLSFSHGIRVGDPGAQMAQSIASTLFIVTAWAMKIVLDVFGWAFNLDLVNGANGQPGVLDTVATATQSLYTTVVGSGLLAAAVAGLGIWAISKGLLQRRFSELTTGIAISVALVAVAMLFIAKPVETIGYATKQTNELSNAILGGGRSASDGKKAATKAQDSLWEVFVYQPWAVTEFGGLKHCNDTSRPDDAGFPKPVPATASPGGSIVCRDHLKQHGGFGGYAPMFLNFPANGAVRDDMTTAMASGKDIKLPDPPAPTSSSGGSNSSAPHVAQVPGTTPTSVTAVPGADSNENVQATYSAETRRVLAGWKVDKADASAVDMMLAGGAYQRLAFTVVLFIGMIGAVLLLGSIAIVCLVAQVAAVFLLAFTPVVLLCGLIPGWGHRLFKAWALRLAQAVFIKLIYTLLLTVLITMSAALTAATGGLGFVFAFGAQAAMYWVIFLKRKQLANMLPGPSHGHAGAAMLAPARVAATAVTGGGAAVAGAMIEKRYESRHTADSKQSGTGDDPATSPQSPSPSTNGTSANGSTAKPPVPDGSSAGNGNGNGNGNGHPPLTTVPLWLASDNDSSGLDPQPRGPQPDMRPEERPAPPPSPQTRPTPQGPPPDARPEEHPVPASDVLRRFQPRSEPDAPAPFRQRPPLHRPLDETPPDRP